MAKQTRPCYIVGNWKMYKTIDQAVAFIDQIAPLVANSSCKIMLAVPYTAIQPLSEKVKGTNIVIGAQNMNDATEGAFTGEIAAIMLKEAGAEFVLLGHSERRIYFKEDNAFINRKVLKALDSDLMPILCVGESFEEHQDKQTDKVVAQQLTECLQGVKKELMVAYEPVWAIGTGLAATPKVAESAMKQAKAVLGDILGDKVGSKVPLLYGGSVSPKNAQEFLESSEIDGLLVGSASLAAESFAQIISLQAK